MSGKKDTLDQGGNESEDPISYPSYHIPSVQDVNTTTTCSTLIPTANNSISACGDVTKSAPCPSVSMVDSFHPTNISRHQSFSGINPQIIVSRLNDEMGPRSCSSERTCFGRPLDSCWTTPDLISRGVVYFPDCAATLSHLSMDSGFTERAARFSSFGGGGFCDLLKPIGIPETGGPPRSRELSIFQGQQQDTGMYSPENVVNTTEGQRDTSFHGELGNAGCQLQRNQKSEKSDNETKQGLVIPENESDEQMFSRNRSKEVTSALKSSCGETFLAEGLCSKKRKLSDPDVERDRGKLAETEGKMDQDLDMATNKPAGKFGKQVPQASSSQKEEYMHIRARRGQATNSHSLAERVRREKISERMKLLQDLVPGCSKVTGKAVMLDEIINYVQSLQRQVEFLSMKLATVTPKLEINVGGISDKDVLQSFNIPSSSTCFPPDMLHNLPLLHTGIVHSGPSGIGNSDFLRKTIDSQLTAMSIRSEEVPSQQCDLLLTIFQQYR